MLWMEDLIWLGGGKASQIDLHIQGNTCQNPSDLSWRNQQADSKIHTDMEVLQ